MYRTVPKTLVSLMMVGSGTSTTPRELAGLYFYLESIQQ